MTTARHGLEQGPSGGRREFHVARAARDRYQLDQTLFSLRGELVFANFYAARLCAQRINERRDVIAHPERAVRAGQLNALGLIEEIQHYVIGLYQRQERPDAFAAALARLDARFGRSAVDATLLRFVEEFPPLAVYRGELDPATYLRGQTDGVSNRELALEDLLLLWLANVNPAAAPLAELFADGLLARETAYRPVIAELERCFGELPPFGPDAEPLVAMLRRPAREVPDSLSGQLEYIRRRWGHLIGPLLVRLLTGLDLVREEEKLVFLGPGGAPPGPGPVEVYEFTGLEREPERFTPDRDWMPQLVLIAKNTYVWLDQLSRRYGRPIRRLDEVPEEELATLARWGISGLWLIGLWERSPASRRIKQLMGNPAAEASAYSLFDYQIAADLGGEEALARLRERAARWGIRLGSDLVPNHMGIDSRWVIERPDWFIALDASPFPSYTFSGPDLSWHPAVGIFLEDHYYTRTDAAVVFKRVDRATGRERYVYHGNDGTSMPWNDTAQLNYLKPEVRAAMIETILGVARQFPIIRFDAAMTLTKQHYQRLWFPEPGSGGDIPSRAEHGLTREQFDALMPEEFWREVVDRVAREAPETLLLAEAFWFMEGYFVRTLGMHRVYNSAFMNMLRDERNADYRQLLKNTLEFDPEILKRYVNFMNNPDERTAVDQFGKGDKYFGICTLMATLPGLPMFGHGQFEGFAEKYGMEYRRALWDEQPDPELVARHEREIVPLLRRRALFAGVEHFLLYDLFTPAGQVDENVFAFSNRLGEERALIVYHNRYADTRGWLRTSAAYAVKGPGGERTLVQRTLGEGLGLSGEPDRFCIFRDHVSGLEYLRASREIVEQGLYVELGAYRYHVFLDFREVRDTDRQDYARLAAALGGRGVPSVGAALRDLLLEPVRGPFRALFTPDRVGRLMAAAVRTPGGAVEEAALAETEEAARRFFQAVKAHLGSDRDERALAEQLRRELAVALRLPVLGARAGEPERPPDRAERPAPGAAERAPQARAAAPGPGGRAELSPTDPARAALGAGFHDDAATWGTLAAWLFVRQLGRLGGEDGAAERARGWLDEWALGPVIAETLRALGLAEEAAGRAVERVKVLVAQQRWFAPPADQQGAAGTAVAAARALERWLQDVELQRFLGVNRADGVLWYRAEALDELLWWLLALAAIDALAAAERPGPERLAALAERAAIVAAIRQAGERSAYQVERLRAALRSAAARSGGTAEG